MKNNSEKIELKVIVAYYEIYNKEVKLGSIQFANNEWTFFPPFRGPARPLTADEYIAIGELLNEMNGGRT